MHKWVIEEVWDARGTQIVETDHANSQNKRRVSMWMNVEVCTETKLCDGLFSLPKTKLRLSQY